MKKLPTGRAYSPATVANEVFKSFKKLKEIVERLQAENKQ